MKCLTYLQQRITDKMTIADIVDTFERMCQIPIENDMVLFETGTFSFTGESLFYFSLVRQFPNEEEEYHQIHVDVLYKPSKENRVFSEAVWNTDITDIDENIFDYIRKSKAFAYAKCDQYMKIDIYMDET